MSTNIPKKILYLHMKILLVTATSNEIQQEVSNEILITELV